MIKRLVLILIWLVPAVLAHAADGIMGDVTLKLIPPKGYCELDPAQASDKRLIDFLNTTIAKVGNDLLAASADCAELRDWRTGKLPLLQHLSQYQVERVRRTSAFSIQTAKEACEVVRQQGQALSDKSTKNVAEKIHEANSKIDFQGQTFLGVLEDDPNGCYVGVFQKFKAETGAAVAQVNVFFMGSIKERELFFYVWVPFQDDSTVKSLLVDVKGYMVAIKAANGL